MYAFVFKTPVSWLNKNHRKIIPIVFPKLYWTLFYLNTFYLNHPILYSILHLEARTPFSTIQCNESTKGEYKVLSCQSVWFAVLTYSDLNTGDPLPFFFLYYKFHTSAAVSLVKKYHSQSQTSLQNSILYFSIISILLDARWFCWNLCKMGFLLTTL